LSFRPRTRTRPGFHLFRHFGMFVLRVAANGLSKLLRLAGS